MFPPCEVWPHLLLTAAWGIAVLLFVQTIKTDSALPKWKWGDAPRRQRRDTGGLLTHVAGAMLAAFAVAFALNHPMCG